MKKIKDRVFSAKFLYMLSAFLFAFMTMFASFQMGRYKNYTEARDLDVRNRVVEVTPTNAPTPAPTCIERPVCMDANPPCKIVDIGYCPPSRK